MMQHVPLVKRYRTFVQQSPWQRGLACELIGGYAEGGANLLERLAARLFYLLALVQDAVDRGL